MSKVLVLFAVLAVSYGCNFASSGPTAVERVAEKEKAMQERQEQDQQASKQDLDLRDDPNAKLDLPKTNEEWQAKLEDMQYRVTRLHGTERAFSGTYWDNKKDGVYRCVCCELPLFSSDAKYKSGTGWPSYWQPVDSRNVETEEDRKLLSVRTEVHCKRCKAHLGHVFDDGPEPTGLRYCINSASLTFEEKKK